MRKINDAGLNLIKKWEGLRLESYDDGGGVWTIGYGHTDGVKPGQKITEAQAVRFLSEDLSWAESAVEKQVPVDLSDNQFAALVSLVFNIGQTAFSKSTLRKALLKKDYDEAAKQFVRWSYDNGKFIQGLKNRRLEELELFLKEED